MKSGTSLCINILSTGVSYSESACQKQLPVTFRMRVCPQSCTQRVRFCQDLSESTWRNFLGAARASLQTGVSQATRALTANWLNKTAIHSPPNARLPSILHSEGLFLPGPQQNHTAHFFGCSLRNNQNRSLPSYSLTHSNPA